MKKFYLAILITLITNIKFLYSQDVDNDEKIAEITIQIDSVYYYDNDPMPFVQLTVFIQNLTNDTILLSNVYKIIKPLYLTPIDGLSSGKNLNIYTNTGVSRDVSYLTYFISSTNNDKNDFDYNVNGFVENKDYLQCLKKLITRLENNDSSLLTQLNLKIPPKTIKSLKLYPDLTNYQLFNKSYYLYLLYKYETYVITQPKINNTDITFINSTKNNQSNIRQSDLIKKKVIYILSNKVVLNIKKSR